MDEEAFNALLISLRREVFLVEQKIKSYGPDMSRQNL